MLQVLSGIDPVLFFTVDIFQAAGSTIDEYYSTMLVGLAQMVKTCPKKRDFGNACLLCLISSLINIQVGAIGAACLIDRYGRKIFLIVSEIVMVISLCTLSLYFYLKFHNNDEPYPGLGWLPLSSLIVFVSAYRLDRIL